MTSHWLKAVYSKLEDRDIQAVLRILSSNDSLVNVDANSVKELRSKLPKPPDDRIPSPDNEVQPLQATNSDNLREIRSFPSWSKQHKTPACSGAGHSQRYRTCATLFSHEFHQYLAKRRLSRKSLTCALQRYPVGLKKKNRQSPANRHQLLLAMSGRKMC